jgi:hypothetical protein
MSEYNVYEIRNKLTGLTNYVFAHESHNIENDGTVMCIAKITKDDVKSFMRGYRSFSDGVSVMTPKFSLIDKNVKLDINLFFATF